MTEKIILWNTNSQAGQYMTQFFEENNVNYMTIFKDDPRGSRISLPNDLKSTFREKDFLYVQDRILKQPELYKKTA